MPAIKPTPELNKIRDQMVLGLFKKKNSVFLSTILAGLAWEWTDDADVPVAAVSNKMKMYFNATKFLELTREMRITVLAHELWHVAFHHLFRLGTRNAEIWNMACDHAINLMLHDEGYLFNISHLADGQFRGMSADQIYNELVSQATPIELPFGSDMMPSPPGNEEKDSVAETKMTALIVRATTAAEMSSQAGNLPGEVKHRIEQLLHPRLRWDDILHKFFSELSTEEQDWKRPNRRYQDMYLPSRGGQNRIKRIAWILDRSGSITYRQLETFNGALKDAKETCNPEQMVIATFDTEIHDVWVFDEHTVVGNLEVTGGGGTSLVCVREFLRAGKFDAAVVFSDLDCEPMDRLPGCDVVWLCFDNPYAEVGHGRLVHCDTVADY